MSAWLRVLMGIILALGYCQVSLGQTENQAKQDRYILMAYGTLPDGFIVHPKFEDAIASKSIRTMEGLALLESLYAAKDYRVAEHLALSYIENSRPKRPYRGAKPPYPDAKEKAARLAKGMAFLEDHADRGYSRSQLLLSKYLMTGDLVFKIKADKQRGEKYRLMAAQAGDPIAMSYLANDDNDWSEKAADMGHIKSMERVYFQNNDGVDDTKAEKYLKMAFDAGSDLAYNIYVEKGLAPAKPKSEISKFLEAQGTSKQTVLLHYNPEAQKRYIEKQRALAAAQQALNPTPAAKAFNPKFPAQDGFDAFEAGQYVKAREILRPYADNGDGDAENVLGIMYLDALGVGRNYETADKWFRKAARQNHMGGQYHLGYMIYYQHTGGGVDPWGTAKELFEKSSAQGFEPAAKMLTVMAEDDRLRRVREKKEFDDSIDDIQLGRCRNPYYYTVNGRQKVRCD